jgi:hypothetical protein
MPVRKTFMGTGNVKKLDGQNFFEAPVKPMRG